MDYRNFLNDMGERPNGLFIERIDNNGGYNPSNCKWGTRVDQNRNRRNNVKLTYQGETMLLIDWASRIGISYKSLMDRLYSGWTVERAITQPIRKGNYK